MLTFHALLFPRPEGLVPRSAVTVGSRAWESLEIAGAELHRGWQQTWEETMARLALLPRAYPEPDGSFVWATAEGKLSGVLYDRAGKMCYAELFGECSREMVEKFLHACGSPDERFVFQLPREGLTLEEATFLEFTQR